MALLIPPKVAKEIRKGIPDEDWKGLKKRLERIACNPTAPHPDVKPFEDGFRVRHGIWRAIYTVTENGDVVVVRTGHRREVYR